MNTNWTKCLKFLEKKIPEKQLKTWLLPLTCVVDNNNIILFAPNKFIYEKVNKNYLKEISLFFNDHLSDEFKVYLKEKRDASADKFDSNLKTNTNAKKITYKKSKILEKSKLNSFFSFDNFVNGKANQLARAAALQVSENPGDAYNPLFIYGGVGLGKTHLIHAIGNLVLQNSPNAKIRYIHAEQYVSDVVKAYQHKAFDGFKKYYHSLDLLLIDDIQFFAGKNRTQEEFFYAYNALIEENKQVIISCDSYPKEISGVEDRLISRFGWGLTVAIEPPELEMRVAIILKKAELEKIIIPEDVAFFIANLIHSNVRELEGAIKRVVAFAKFNNSKISIKVAKRALKDLLAIQSRQTSIENIQKIVCDFFKLKTSDMYSKKRTRNVARPRQIAMTLSKELTNLSLPDIGEAFGGRDHTTVLHAHRKISELKKTDKLLKKDYASLIRIIRG